MVELDPVAPTALREPTRVIDDHLADSLAALSCKRTRTANPIADLGTGAGFPGLPLAIARPDATLSLVESSARKCAFVRRAVNACGLQNVRVVNARAEQWPEGLKEFELVTARALAPLPVVAEYAAPLLRIGGALVVWRGRRDHDAERAAVLAAADLGLETREPVRVEPYDGAEHRYLQLMVKVRETPDRFPRRPGIARKRPLAGRPRTSTAAEGRGSPTGNPPGPDAAGTAAPV
ncbi:MAG: 16S rRNA (guanine(527)-N(7))-methyltransferase RsmG [Solirubrobacteraceae bacterium]